MKNRCYLKYWFAGVLPVFGVMILVIMMGGSCHRVEEQKTFQVLVLHSYESDYSVYPSFNWMIEDGFRKQGVPVQIKTLYLNCEQYLETEEIERASLLLNSVEKGWRPDVILINDDQAVYSFLKCGHPFMREIPVVFAGVNYPNMDLINSCTNVMGFWDRIDFVNNCRFIEQLLGKSRILFFHDNTFLGRNVMKDFATQLRDTEIPLFEDWVYLWMKDPDMNLDTIGRQQDKEYQLKPPVGTSVWATPIREAKAPAVLWIMGGMLKHSVFLQTKRDVTTMRIGKVAGAPCCTVINEGFGNDQGILGGYITTLRIQVEEEVKAAVDILRGESVKNKPIRVSRKEYVCDWREMERRNISIKQIPAGCAIINMPLWERYKVFFVLLSVSGGALVIILIAYLLFLYNRELKRKRRAQYDLEKEKEFLSLALEGGNIYAWRYDRKTKLFSFDKDFFVMLGLKQRDFTVQDFDAMVHADDRQNAQRVLVSVLDGERKKAAVRIRCLFVGEKYHWWEFRVVYMENWNKQENMLIGLCLDVQEYKDKEEELIEARDLAAKAELKQSFLANMSHEIRTPLNAIVGFSNLLVNDAELEDEDKKEFIGIINTNCDLLLKLVNDVLELSRIESGHMSFTLGKCDLTELLDEIYRTQQREMHEGVVLLEKLPTEPILITVDKLRLQQVITNFINNAVKFTSAGHILIGCTYDRVQKQVCIYVEDTGLGIPEKEQRMIFNRFYKQNEFAQGTGLGLAICSVIVEKLGGNIQLESEVGKGSRFMIVFPNIVLE